MFQNTAKLSALLVVLFLTSCNTYKTIKMVFAEEAVYTDYTNGTKNVRFVEMAHISTKKFYTDVERLVIEAKTNHYVLFYEFVDFHNTSEINQRKIRKMVGMLPTPEDYTKTLEKMDNPELAAQHNEQFLNKVNELDFNVDVSGDFVVEEYEKRYGEIILTETDITTPLTEKVEDTLPKKKVFSVILDSRNVYLSEQINTSEYDNIIVLYGARHKKGLLKELKKLDEKERISTSLL